MMFYDFETTTYGKWILAGEHAVIRGHGALVFPIKEKRFILKYRAATTNNAEYNGYNGQEMHLLFGVVLDHGCKLLGCSPNLLQGHFHIDNTIPVGGGMGASAALCVAVSRFFAFKKIISDERCNEFAKELEHLFHGKSSGLDIAGVSANGGLYFKEGAATPLKQTLSPIWYLSSCNEIGITATCIQKVQRLWDKDPVAAQQIDMQMVNAVNEARTALEQEDVSGIELMTTAIQNAADCFAQWGLITDSLQQHMTQLYDNGALAVKPTGSGGGGYVLSLWDKEPINSSQLIRV